MSKETRKKAVSGKRFGAGSVIDIVIVLLILAAVISIGYRVYTTSNPTVSAQSGEYEIFFRIDSVSFMLPHYLKEGDKVYLKDSDMLLGTLLNESDYEDGTALSVSAATVTVPDDNGNYVSVKYPDESLVDAVGALLATGYLDEDGSFLLDGKTHVTPGGTLRVSTELVDFTLIVTEIVKH